MFDDEHNQFWSVQLGKSKILSNTGTIFYKRNIPAVMFIVHILPHLQPKHLSPSDAENGNTDLEKAFPFRFFWRKRTPGTQQLSIIN
mmetsp:Transcript_1127/g.2308  ORF Transcript_1127/g.2308 Transcript_1127/m.2308 type:complete len:87 (-) Transcript_1127:2565-2825(-)